MLCSRCAGLDVHKKEVVACLRLVVRNKVSREVRRFPTTTRGLIELAEWLEAADCKSDVNDATWIADLLAHGLIRASFVPPRPDALDARDPDRP
jgi:transposase